ncbi:MAG: DUF1028 domain-containing protein [Sediminibacterium sp.]|nr:DUF1028 domain-containing protein [Sediminibacterium sp.]
MKKRLLVPFVLLLHLSVFAQDTFSIVGADSLTRQVGSSGASCVDLTTTIFAGNPGFLGDLLPDTGAINTQASYLPQNQNNARSRMRLGQNAQQIISWLSTNDVSNTPATRQYGVVAFSGNSITVAGFTGTNCLNYKNHLTGRVDGFYYSIQGNILSGQHVLDSMEARFRREKGDLKCRLMAALQGAKTVGADTRCASNNTSSLFAFLKVSNPADSYGNPSFSIGVITPSGSQKEPIDSLQTVFNQQANCTILTKINTLQFAKSLRLFPNPANETVCIESSFPFSEASCVILNLVGEEVLKTVFNGTVKTIPVAHITKGFYICHITEKGVSVYNTPLIIK